MSAFVEIELIDGKADVNSPEELRRREDSALNHDQLVVNEAADLQVSDAFLCGKLQFVADAQDVLLALEHFSVHAQAQVPLLQEEDSVLRCSPSSLLPAHLDEDMLVKLLVAVLDEPPLVAGFALLRLDGEESTVVRNVLWQ